jgi:hypothetical protein
VVSDIIGAEDGLGVENLSGSGAIASIYWCGPRTARRGMGALVGARACVRVERKGTGRFVRRGPARPLQSSFRNSHHPNPRPPSNPKTPRNVPPPHSRAWREGFTITLVSGRTVGIGAYLARLGRRCVQRADQPVILTGYAALNKARARLGRIAFVWFLPARGVPPARGGACLLCARGRLGAGAAMRFARGAGRRVATVQQALGARRSRPTNPR